MAPDVSLTQGNLYSWMTDKLGRDQFVIKAGNDVVVFWNDGKRNRCEEVRTDCSAYHAAKCPVRVLDAAVKLMLTDGDSWNCVQTHLGRSVHRHSVMLQTQPGQPMRVSTDAQDTAHAQLFENACPRRCTSA